MIDEKQKLVIECMTYAFLIQENTDYCVFIRFSGHVDSLEIEISETKVNWKNKVCESEFYTSFREYYDKDRNDPLCYLKSRRDVLKRILETEEIPYNEMDEHIEELRSYHF